MKKLFALSLIFCICTPALPEDRSDIIPLGNWAKVESLNESTMIAVHLFSGDTIEGEFIDLAPNSIRLWTGRQMNSYLRESIAEIRLPGVKDSNKNGALIGLGIGAGLAGITIAAKYDKRDPYRNMTWGAIPLFAVAGALLGYAIDNSRKVSTRAIFRARNTAESESK